MVRYVAALKLVVSPTRLSPGRGRVVVADVGVERCLVLVGGVVNSKGIVVGNGRSDRSLVLEARGKFERE
ncbi:hypothetical protein BM221_006861 [Beauveria bassiana]|uniref:Uncharacterized protein n=1 Tax=Beauveria bassiana TaxID=176275 RepID=A0A2N6NIU1_BEABA|nr:hypothetical protein BM221_006861 [Beauveria bassiana]